MIVYVRLRTLEGVLRNQNLGRGKFGLKTRTVSGLLNTQWSLYGEGTAALDFPRQQTTRANLLEL